MSELSLADIDVGSHDRWVEGVPHEMLTLLRDQAPVFRHDRSEPDQPEFYWCLTRHADVRMANRDWETFSSEVGGVQLFEKTDDHFNTMIDTDPPDHTRLRRLVNRGFTPRMVARFTAHYAELTDELLDKAIATDEIDFVTAVAAELPLIAIAELLGIPPEDRARIFHWTNTMVGNSDPEYVTDPGAPLDAAMEFFAYANELADERRADPRDDIVTKLITEVDGDALGPVEFEAFVLMLSVAGNETTRNAISHGMLALLEHPEQMAILRRDPTTIDTAVEEILRWATPVSQFRRTATRDVELHGVTIEAGDAVVLYYASANRDEREFPDPFTFDVCRTPNDHLSFGGGGPHFCLGANLARLEMKIMFEQLLAKTSGIRLLGPPDRLRSNFINGIKRLPVALDAS